MAGPSLGERHGSLCSYIYAPHPVPGKGVCFSPNGDLIIRYGFSAEITVLRAHDVTVIRTLMGATGSVRFANFSSDGRFILAAAEGWCIQDVPIH